MSDSKKNNKQLVSLALVLGMWSPFIHASDTIKIDEKSFQEMLDKKNKEGMLIEEKHIKRKASILSTDLTNKLKDISISSKKSINVIIALKTEDINLKPLSSVGQVSLNKDGKQEALIDGGKQDIEL